MASSQSTGIAASEPAHRPSDWLWVLVGVLVLVVGGCVAAQAWIRSLGQTSAAAVSSPDPSPSGLPAGRTLDGQFNVIVRPPVQGIEPLVVEERGALPVRAGGIMSLEVLLNQPAFVYCIWLDCEGKVLPLYPWNTDLLEVKDINQPPPMRQPARVVYSPLLGYGWKFGNRGGVETVILLARRTPLEEATQLGALLGQPPPPPAMRLKDELLMLGLHGRDCSPSVLLARNRGDDQEAQAADEPLHKLLVRLGEHFELVRAVRFAHQGE
jgi:hypothetical protein